jgi:hypothetical protein
MSRKKEILLESVKKLGVIKTSEFVKISIIDLVNELNLPYKTFNDIQFQPHQHFNGVKSFTEFKNGYGVSVIRTEYSYGGNRGLYEIAIMKNDEIVYDTPITNDVLGYLTPEDVTVYMIKIQDL